MTQWTDSQVQETASVASTSETQLGSNVNIPQNQTWQIQSLYWAHAGDGTGRIAIDSIPGMTGVTNVGLPPGKLIEAVLNKGFSSERTKNIFSPIVNLPTSASVFTLKE